MLEILSSILLRLLFYKVPTFEYSKAEKLEYDRIFDNALNQDGMISYRSSYPKSRFIHYISQTRDVVLHGSNNKQIQEFEPRKQTMFNGHITEAVFASKDGIWPVFYAILDRKKIVHNFRNGSVGSGASKKRYHFYSLDKETVRKNPLTSGMIYFLPSETFTKIGLGAIAFDEWISKVPVKPLLKLEVNQSDFYFINKVSIHHHQESIARTWLLYKLRTFFHSKNKEKPGKFL